MQAIVLGPLIGLPQATALGDHTRRWMGWLAANLTIYLLAAVAYSPASARWTPSPSRRRSRPPFPLLG